MRWLAFLTRCRAMIVKEMWAVLRDPRARIILIAPPIMQLVLFASAATLEVRNVDIGVLDLDHGPAAHEVLGQMAGSPNIRVLVPLASYEALARAIDRRQVLCAVILPEGLSRDVAARHPASAGAVCDGRRSNSAQIMGGYLSQIVGQAGLALRGVEARAGGQNGLPGGQSTVRHMFNPNLDFLLFVLPALVATVASISALSVAGQSVARERELGSFDQLMVAPLRLSEILIGKMAPPLIVGLVNATLYLLVITMLFGEPLRGSLISYYLATFFFLTANIGLGMTVSSLAQTQQQAFLGIFLVAVPVNLLSGFAAPVDNMPLALRIIAQADPQKHMVVLMEGLFLKAMPMMAVLANVWPLMAISAVTLTVSTLLFRSRME
ncbi:MAG: ABC transporter permease [Sphingomonadales bacterium]|nr:ABC transporter permease [Sphingomonadales bacterium]MDE2167839.1 ABC transporter permease [Sphingomonadales bacterium]